MKIVNEPGLFIRINFVDRQKERPVGLSQETNEFKIGACQFRPPIHDHDDGGRFIKSDAGLPKDLRRDEGLFVRHDSTSVDNSQLAAVPLCIAIEAISRDARLVSYDRA